MTSESQRVEAIAWAICKAENYAINDDAKAVEFKANNPYYLDQAKAAIAADPRTEEYAKAMKRIEQLEKELRNIPND